MSLPTLADFRGKTIEVECVECERYASIEYKQLVKRFGAAAQFADLRRPLAMGCDKMMGPDGESKCRVRFPCLYTASIAFPSKQEKSR